MRQLLYPAFILLLAAVLPAQETGNYTVSDSLAIAEITLEEMQLYQADFLPLSLAEKGRQSAPTWRGMPPGYLDYRFDNISLFNPLWGYWDNQHVPVEMIRNRALSPYSLQYRLVPVVTRQSAIPVSRIAFSQDFQFDLSYLDANLRSYYRPKSYFHLSGSNFKRTGTAGDFSTIQVNTYRGQIHHQITDRWSVDLWYWQIRHKFALASFPVAMDIDRFSKVVQLGWVNIQFEPDSSQQLWITPYGSKWQDQYHNQDYSQQRKTRLYSAGVNTGYRKYARRWEFSVMADAVRHEVTQAFVFPKDNQLDARMYADGFVSISEMRFGLGGGYRWVEDLGQLPELRGSWEWQLPLGINSLVAAHREPKMLPLSHQWWEGYHIAAVADPRLPLRQGISWQLTLPGWPGSRFHLEPYYHQYEDAPYYSGADSAFVQRNFETTGVKLGIRSRFWHFELEDEFNYSDNYRNTFTPRFNNVLKVNLAFPLFKGALKLENYVIYHFIGSVNRFGYVPLTNQYLLGTEAENNYHLLDVKILGHIKTATIFFVWENLASQDIALVNGYYELYRLFRFGIYWTLFD